jgi:hypothetical protein
MSKWERKKKRNYNELQARNWSRGNPVGLGTVMRDIRLAQNGCMFKDQERESYPTREAAQEAIDRLRTAPTKILQCILCGQFHLEKKRYKVDPERYAVG